MKRSGIYAGVALILALWWGAAIWVGQEILLPAPPVVARTLVRLIGSRHFLSILGSSLLRWVAGFSLSLAWAILFASIAYRSSWMTAVFRPIVVTVRSIPVIAIILLALIWMPVDLVPVFVSFLVSFPLLYQGGLDGLRSVDSDLIDMGRLFRIHPMRRVRHIFLPGALPVILSVLTSAVGMSWKAVIAAEVLSQPVRAIGTNMHIAKLYLETPEVIAWTVVAVALAAIGDGIIWYVDARTTTWRTAAVVPPEEGPATNSADDMPLELPGVIASINAVPRGVGMRNVSFSFPGVPLFRDFCLDLPPGKVTAILGRSGTGKTTLLRLIAGDVRPHSGEIKIEPPPESGALEIGFVFQEPRLLPWRSILTNVELVLPRAGSAHDARHRRDSLIAFFRSLRLPRPEAYPATLSGGMRHRVNVARGFFSGTSVICMDEPYANQDVATRHSLMHLTRTLEAELGRTIVLVTHDPEEALELADTVIVLADQQPTAVLGRFVVDRDSLEHREELLARIKHLLK